MLTNEQFQIFDERFTLTDTELMLSYLRVYEKALVKYIHIMRAMHTKHGEEQTEQILEMSPATIRSCCFGAIWVSKAAADELQQCPGYVPTDVKAKIQYWTEEKKKFLSTLQTDAERELIKKQTEVSSSASAEDETESGNESNSNSDCNLQVERGAVPQCCPQMGRDAALDALFDKISLSDTTVPEGQK